MDVLNALRQYRIGQFTIFDTVTAYIGILILSPVLSWLMSKLHINVPVISWFWFTLPLSVIFHLIFQQSTPLVKILGSPNHFEFYVAIFILLVTTYMGFRKISKTK